MPHTETSGVRIAYDDSGRGTPALLFLGGWCVNRTVFGDLSLRCAERRRCLTLDWRGHGESQPPEHDFGAAELVADALAVIEASAAGQVVPVALAHSGWVAIELRRKLGARVPKIVFLDWLIASAPPPFLEALAGMQSAERWRATVNRIFEQWLHGVNNAALERFVKAEMGAYGFEMWARAAREIAAAYAAAGSPLQALAQLDPLVPVLHLYGQPADPAFFEAQREFALRHPWFHVQRLDTRSHFPMFEVPKELTKAIEAFVA